MHLCCDKERNKTTSLWSHLTKEDFRYEFSNFTLPVSSICLQYESDPCLPEGCLVNLFILCLRVYVCVSFPSKLFCSVFTEHHRKHHIRRKWGLLQKSLTEPLAPTNLTDPDNTQDYKHHLVYQQISINGCFQLYSRFLDVDSNIYIFCSQQTIHMDSSVSRAQKST